MLLTDGEIEHLVIRDWHQTDEAKIWWKNGDWARIGEKIVIDPFDTANVSPVSYELAVGAEWLSLRKPYEVRQLNPGEVITVAPHEAILILSEEYIALPPTIAGLLVPRARKLFEGSNLAATRVEPTWYGKLIVGFTNLSQYTTSLARGERFCNLVLMKTEQVRRPLSRSNMPHLGRTGFGKPEYPSLRPQDLKNVDQVSAEDINQMVNDFGSPFDIVRGALKENKDEVILAIERDLGPRMVETAVTQAVKQAFRTQQWMFGILLTMFGVLIAGLIAFLFKGP